MTLLISSGIYIILISYGISVFWLIRKAKWAEPSLIPYNVVKIFFLSGLLAILACLVANVIFLFHDVYTFSASFTHELSPYTIIGVWHCLCLIVIIYGLVCLFKKDVGKKWAMMLIMVVGFIPVTLFLPHMTLNVANISLDNDIKISSRGVVFDKKCRVYCGGAGVRRGQTFYGKIPLEICQQGELAIITYAKKNYGTCGKNLVARYTPIYDVKIGIKGEEENGVWFGSAGKESFSLNLPHEADLLFYKGAFGKPWLRRTAQDLDLPGRYPSPVSF